MAHRLNLRLNNYLSLIFLETFGCKNYDCVLFNKFFIIPEIAVNYGITTLRYFTLEKR